MSTANKGEAADRTEAHKELQFITGNNEATANTPPASSPCVRDALRTTRVYERRLTGAARAEAHLLLTIKASVDVTSPLRFHFLNYRPLRSHSAANTGGQSEVRLKVLNFTQRFNKQHRPWSAGSGTHQRIS